MDQYRIVNKEAVYQHFETIFGDVIYPQMVARGNSAQQWLEMPSHMKPKQRPWHTQGHMEAQLAQWEEYQTAKQMFESLERYQRPDMPELLDVINIMRDAMNDIGLYKNLKVTYNDKDGMSLKRHFAGFLRNMEDAIFNWENWG